jgi:hypothetical protein
MISRNLMARLNKFCFFMRVVLNLVHLVLGRRISCLPD